MKKLFLTAVILLIPIYAAADRTVSVTPKNPADIALSNPSAIFLNYNLTCYAADGGMIHSNGYSLSPNMSKTHNVSCMTNGSWTSFNTSMTIPTTSGAATEKVMPAANGCGNTYYNKVFYLPAGNSQNHVMCCGGTAPICANTEANSYNNGMKRCQAAASIPYSQAPEQCVNGSHVCSLQEWHDNQGNNPTFDHSFLNYGNLADFSFCSGASCQLPTAVAKPISCKIQVTGNNGHLTSPDFKAGAPF